MRDHLDHPSDRQQASLVIRRMRLTVTMDIASMLWPFLRSNLQARHFSCVVRSWPLLIDSPIHNPSIHPSIHPMDIKRFNDLCKEGITWCIEACLLVHQSHHHPSCTSKCAINARFMVSIINYQFKLQCHSRDTVWWHGIHLITHPARPKWTDQSAWRAYPKRASGELHDRQEVSGSCVDVRLLASLLAWPGWTWHSGWLNSYRFLGWLKSLGWCQHSKQSVSVAALAGWLIERVSIYLHGWLPVRYSNSLLKLKLKLKLHSSGRLGDVQKGGAAPPVTSRARGGQSAALRQE